VLRCREADICFHRFLRLRVRGDIPSPPYAFMVWYLMKNRDNFAWHQITSVLVCFLNWKKPE
jgi:hypothetical protein